MASPGYPASAKKDLPITGLDKTGKDVIVFHAGTKKDGTGWATNGGRVFGVTAVGRDLAQARDKAYAAVSKISFEGMQYRTDIASPVLAAK